MRHIGRSVLFLAAKPGNPRNGESTCIRLRDGRIMFAYTEYYGDSWEDHAIAHLCGSIVMHLPIPRQAQRSAPAAWLEP